MENNRGIEEQLRVWIANHGENPDSLSQMEGQVRYWMHKLGNMLLFLWLFCLSPRYPERRVTCPHCGEQANYQRKRQATLRTVFGVVHYQRAYYLCAHCHHGHYPLDIDLGLRPNAMSAEVERLAAMVAVEMPFAKGAVVFEELTLISISDQSLDKAAQAYGAEIEQWEDESYEQSLEQEWMLARERDNSAPLRLYGSMDGGRVQTRAAQGEVQPWRELKVGAWFEAKGQPPSKPNGKWTIRAQNISYYSDIASAEDFGKIMWATGVDRQADRTIELVFLGDGARWIWDLVTLYYPDAIQIVDWFHACEYLTPVSKIAFRDSQKQKDWLERVKNDLWQGHLDAVIAACQTHVQPDLAVEDDPAQQAVRYYSNNRQRMDYPTYRANGYQIGSGTIESGVKQIATQRMKVSGARWNLQSARLVAKARAAYLSGQWQQLAQRREYLSKCA